MSAHFKLEYGKLWLTPPPEWKVTHYRVQYINVVDKRFSSSWKRINFCVRYWLFHKTRLNEPKPVQMFWWKKVRTFLRRGYHWLHSYPVCSSYLLYASWYFTDWIEGTDLYKAMANTEMFSWKIEVKNICIKAIIMLNYLLICLSCSAIIFQV